MLFLFFVTVVAQNYKQHVVKQGETISSIASLYQVSVEQIKSINNDTDNIFPGLILNIPEVKAVEEESKKEEPKKEKPSVPQKVDRVELIDGSFLLCKVVGIKNGWVSIEQKEVSEKTLKIPFKEVVVIKYANGVVKRYKK